METRVQIPLGLRRKPQVTSLITAAPINVLHKPIAPPSPVTALESAIVPENEALRATASRFRDGPGPCGPAGSHVLTPSVATSSPSPPPLRLD